MNDQTDIDEAAFAQQQQDEAQAREIAPATFPEPFSEPWNQRMRLAMSELKEMSEWRLTWPKWEDRWHV